MADVEEPEMTADEFKARQAAGFPVRIVTSREAYLAAVGNTEGGVRLYRSAAITARANRTEKGKSAAGTGVSVKAASSL